MLAIVGFMASCDNKPAETTEAETSENTETAETPAETKAESATYTVNTESSNIRWEGGTSGVQVYSHWGNIKLTEGTLEMEGDALVGGSFIVDMTSIEPKDDGFSEENTPEKLVGHLSTGDFFLVEEHPTASFEITSVSGNTANGNLTVRGNTHEESVNIESITVGEDGTATAKGTLTFDRQKYDVNWAHYLKDVLLKDDIDLQIELVANK